MDEKQEFMEKYGNYLPSQAFQLHEEQQRLVNKQQNIKSSEINIKGSNTIDSKDKNCSGSDIDFHDPEVAIPIQNLSPSKISPKNEEEP